MWQTDWAENSGPVSTYGKGTASALPLDSVESVYVLHWRENCLECAQPDCYRTCPLYVERRDKRCARFENGIRPNRNFSGLFPFGAEVHFRRWGVLESALGGGSQSARMGSLAGAVDRLLARAVRGVSALLSPVSPKYRLSRAYGVFRDRLSDAFGRRRHREFDEFVIEVWNLQLEPVRLVVECLRNGPGFRASVVAAPGRTLHRIPVASMHLDLNKHSGAIRLYPENDAPAHLVFTWLDFVRYRPARVPHAAEPARPAPAEAAVPAASVKCVIWDLDNTLWEGVLGEQDPAHVSLRPGVRETLEALDARGVLLSVASKNDHADAWAVLERLGLAHLFLHPRIHWRPKSDSVREIAGELNIGIDACAFIDDSAFERAEVAARHPSVRVYTERDVPALLTRPEFDVPVTEESRRRRSYYVAESGRKALAAGCGSDYEAFLRSCEMNARVFTPAAAEHVERSLELLHRTNQLNLTTHRYTRQELDALLHDPSVLALCTACRDRFGDYGIVGFATLKPEGEQLFLVDFVFSCRVAQKKVENAWFAWVAGEARASGYDRLFARYVPTSRNHVLLTALHEVGFAEVDRLDGATLLELDCRVAPPSSSLVSVEASAAGRIPSALAAKEELV